jgi:serine protease Do
MKSLFERLRTRRLASTFVVLALFRLRDCGRLFPRTVSADRRSRTKADATPLHVVNSSCGSQRVCEDCQRGGSGGGEHQHGDSAQAIDEQAAPNPHGFQRCPETQNPGDDDQDDDQPQGQGQGQGNFQDFFNRFFGGQMPDQEGGDDGQVRESLGSGFIVDPKGYIITNNHVIEKADKIYVKLSTDPDTQDLGRPARVIGDGQGDGSGGDQDRYQHPAADGQAG